MLERRGGDADAGALADKVRHETGEGVAAAGRRRRRSRRRLQLVQLLLQRLFNQ